MLPDYFPNRRKCQRYSVKTCEEVTSTVQPLFIAELTTLNLFFVYSDIAACRVRIKIFAPLFEKWRGYHYFDLKLWKIIKKIILNSGKILKVASPKDGSWPIFFCEFGLCHFAKNLQSAYDLTLQYLNPSYNIVACISQLRNN